MSAVQTAYTTTKALNLEQVKLLLVEDNPADVLLVTELLSESQLGPFVLEHVENTEGALAYFQDNQPDLCLVDYKLGLDSGFELLFEASKGRIQVPMILLSGVGDYRTDLEAMQLGAFDYLEKSALSSALLERSIRYAIQQFRLVEALRQTAEEDGLTKLQNATAFKKRLAEAIARAKRSHKLLGLLFVDLDGFKAVNDTSGHDLGDEVLKLVSSRLRATVRQTDIVGRVGGDEFAVILEGLNQPTDANRVCEAIIESIRTCPSEIEDQDFVLGASVGVAIYPTDAEQPDPLLQLADKSMYVAKRRGGNRYSFHHDNTHTEPTSNREEEPH